MDPRLVDPDYVTTLSPATTLSPWLLVAIALVVWLLINLEHKHDSNKSQSSRDRDNARLDTQRNSSAEDDK